MMVGVILPGSDSSSLLRLHQVLRLDSQRGASVGAVRHSGHISER